MSFLNNVFLASLLELCNKKPVSWLTTPFPSASTSLLIASFLLEIGSVSESRMIWIFSETANLVGPNFHEFSKRHERFAGVVSSSAKLGFEVIMLNRANVLAGHLQTHPFIVAKTAIRELTAADSGMIRNCLRTRACFPGWIRFVFSDWLGSRVWWNRGIKVRKQSCAWFLIILYEILKDDSFMEIVHALGFEQKWARIPIVLVRRRRLVFGLYLSNVRSQWGCRNRIGRVGKYERARPHLSMRRSLVGWPVLQRAEPLAF